VGFEHGRGEKGMACLQHARVVLAFEHLDLAAGIAWQMRVS
jgi:hypothetical protein